MISDGEVKKLFQNGMKNSTKKIDLQSEFITQVFRGKTPHIKNQPPGGCERHMLLFENFKLIPKNCFGCYKVQVEPKTVVELFKLMIVFNALNLKKDNRRKCMVEGRDNVTGTYKGLVYCDGYEEAEDVFEELKKVVLKDVSEDIPIFLKRGCSEYSLEYPEYGKIDSNQPMEYKEEWKIYEDLADEKLVVNEAIPSLEEYDQQGYSDDDYQVMLLWLHYAATIGDDSYLTISGETVEPLVGLNRASI
jgi:hypothetical protein